MRLCSRQANGWLESRNLLKWTDRLAFQTDSDSRARGVKRRSKWNRYSARQLEHCSSDFW